MFNIKEIPWCSNQTLSINRQKNRVHYIPFADQEEYRFEETMNSERCMLLNGEWDFAWFSSPLDVDRKLLEGRGYTDKLTVPMNWQFAGYGVFHYTDEMYPFPMNPPYVPMTNECGVYHRTLQMGQIEQEDWSYYLNLEGVESAYYVYVNGREAGFNQGSRMHSEFDIGPYLKDGENELVIQVMQYSAATYLEDQDEWWLGGIIRDVYLLKRPKQHIRNVNFTTDYDVTNHSGKISITLKATHRMQVQLELLDPEKNSVFCIDCDMDEKQYTFTKELSDVHSWNAEQPHLYELMVKSKDDRGQITEVLPFLAGFRRLIIQDGVLLWNGRRILMKGVNRHEFNACSGRAVSYEQTKDELLMIKKAGMNAVRTAHYPNNPYFYDLCDRLGLYIIDEADLETHGFEILGEPTTLCEDKKWKQAYLDRIQRMVERDRNHVCIVLWSLGNESSYGQNFKAMYDWVKENEPIRPVHYEGDYKNQSVDVSSTMYSTVGKLAELDSNCNPLRPHILCEFGHAMGNGPGSLGEYFDLIEHSKRIQGCFVWEFKDHGISRDREKQEEAYLYGGDFKEKYHNGNFCMDGLVRSNGEPSPAFYEYQKVIEDIHVIGFDRGTKELVLKNRMDFTDTSKLRCEASIYENDTVIDMQTIDLPVIAAKETGQIDLSSLLAYYDKKKGNYFVKLKFLQEIEVLDDTVIRVLGSFDAALSKEKHRYLHTPKMPHNSKLRIEETMGCYEIEAGSVRLAIDKSSAIIRKYKLKDKEVMEQGPILNLFRAYTDNDKKMVQQWMDMHLNTCSMVVYHSDYTKTDQEIQISFEGYYSPNGMNWGIQTSICYRIDRRGKVEMKISGVFHKAPDVHLPKLGTQLILSENFNRLTYCGMGPMENYCDSSENAALGIYRAAAGNMDQPYDYPQEYGNRTKVEWADFYSEEEGTGIILSAGVPVDFAVRPYSDQQLFEAKHSFELRKEGQLYVNLDYRNSGLGSGSCGPERLEQYQVFPLPFEYSIFIEPYIK